MALFDFNLRQRYKNSATLHIETPNTVSCGRFCRQLQDDIHPETLQEENV